MGQKSVKNWLKVRANSRKDFLTLVHLLHGAQEGYFFQTRVPITKLFRKWLRGPSWVTPHSRSNHRMGRFWKKSFFLYFHWFWKSQNFQNLANFIKCLDKFNPHVFSPSESIPGKIEALKWVLRPKILQFNWIFMILTKFLNVCNTSDIESI